MAARLGISFASVARIWRKWNIQPHRVETLTFSTDPELEATLREVVGLDLDPPAGAVVVSVDEKSRIQALDRSPQPSRRSRGRRSSTFAGVVVARVASFTAFGLSSTTSRPAARSRATRVRG